MAGGADVNARDWRIEATPLHYYAGHRHLPAMERLLAAGADPMARDANGGTPLHRAVGFPFGGAGIAGAIEMLLDAGADPLAQDGSRRTPLDVAEEAFRHLLVPR